MHWADNIAFAHSPSIDQVLKVPVKVIFAVMMSAEESNDLIARNIFVAQFAGSHVLFFFFLLAMLFLFD